jgi:hypothetical protein
MIRVPFSVQLAPGGTVTLDTQAAPMLPWHSTSPSGASRGSPSATAASIRGDTLPPMSAAASITRLVISPALRSGSLARSSAAVPAASGAAIDVPLQMP